MRRQRQRITESKLRRLVREVVRRVREETRLQPKLEIEKPPTDPKGRALDMGQDEYEDELRKRMMQYIGGAFDKVYGNVKEVYHNKKVDVRYYFSHDQSIRWSHADGIEFNDGLRLESPHKYNFNLGLALYWVTPKGHPEFREQLPDDMADDFPDEVNVGGTEIEFGKLVNFGRESRPRPDYPSLGDYQMTVYEPKSASEVVKAATSFIGNHQSALVRKNFDWM